ncbi:MAG: hypothetical protein R2695_21025, partial [Acidimicrobiales bacterium]
YARRQATLADHLAAEGVEVRAGAGLNMWIPVDDEQRAVVALAAHSIGAAPGAPFAVDSAMGPHIRVSVGALRPTDIARVAAVIAAAAAPL